MYKRQIAWFQQLPDQWRLSVSYQMLGNMTWRDKNNLMPAAHRTDVRIARALRIGDTKAEIAFVMQSAEGDQPFFLPSKGFESPRRSFVNLTLEF